MSWSRIVHSLAEVREALAEPGDALDLRVAATLDSDWADLGAHEVTPGELAIPVSRSLADLAATRALGARLAAGLRAGDLVVLSGPLGAGKTSLTQGIGAALGVHGTVTSPTFVLARTHRGQLPLVHVDAYRLRETGTRLDLDDLDLDEALEDAVTVVEWGEGLAERLTDSWLHLQLDRPLTGGTTDGRAGRLLSYGLRWSVVQVH